MLQIDKPLPGPVLLATDGSRDSHLAAAAAVHLSNRARTPLHLVHAWGEPALASATPAP
jgi:Universal stress protein family